MGGQLEKPEAAEQLPGGSRSDDKIINFPGHGDTLSQQQFRLVSYRFPVHPHVCRMVTSQWQGQRMCREPFSNALTRNFYFIFISDYLHVHSFSSVHLMHPGIYLYLLFFSALCQSPSDSIHKLMSLFSIFKHLVHLFIWFFRAILHFASSAQERSYQLFSLLLVLNCKCTKEQPSQRYCLWCEMSYSKSVLIIWIQAPLCSVITPIPQVALYPLAFSNSYKNLYIILFPSTSKEKGVN